MKVDGEEIKQDARNYILKVNCGKAVFGLKYLSACDLLKIPVTVALEIKPVFRLKSEDEKQ